MAARPGRLRELLLSCLLAAAGLLVAVGLAEAAIRIFWPQTVLTLKGLYRADPVVGFRHVPGYSGHERNEEYDVRVEINARGYRDHTYPQPKGAAFRIVGLGDSFTFGSGVEEEEIYLSRLEALLGGGPGRAVEVVNTGTGGMGLDNEARLLMADGPALEPDLVLIGFFLGNDVRDVMCGWDRFEVRGDGLRYWKEGVLERWRRPLRPGEILESPPEPRPGGATSSAALPIPFKATLKENLHLYTFLQRRYDALRERFAERDPSGPSKTFTVFNMEALMIDPYPPELEQGWEETRALLAEIDEWCRRRGARLAVVAIPIPGQVQPGIWDEALFTYGLDPGHLDRTKPQRRLAAIGAELGIPVIDLLPALERARDDGGGRLYYERDIHWTPRGHDVAAAEIERALAAEGLLPPG